MKKNLTPILLLAVFACQKSSSVDADKITNFQISMNTACGWCAPGDSMTVAKATTIYYYFPSSCNKEGKRGA